jgi:hypothetical protein
VFRQIEGLGWRVYLSPETCTCKDEKEKRTDIHSPAQRADSPASGLLAYRSKWWASEEAQERLRG